MNQRFGNMFARIVFLFGIWAFIAFFFKIGY